jgi:hypothetical protein
MASRKKKSPMRELEYARLTIYCSKEELLWLDDLEEPLYVGENLEDHLLFCQLNVRVIAMSTIVDDAVHVQVKVVDYGHLRACYGLVDQRIPLAEPAVEFGDSCKNYTRSSFRLGTAFVVRRF